MSQAQRVPGAPLPAAPERAPRLWHFTYANPELPATLSIVVNAHTEPDGRGLAYLLAEEFSRNIIGKLLPPPE